jgi:hydroxypyruvate reductase
MVQMMATTDSLTVAARKLAARKIARAALDAVDPAECVRRAMETIDLGNPRRVFVLGAGKASAAMAQALGGGVHAGWINTKYGHGVALDRIVCHECGHPVPDEAGVAGARRIAELAREATEDDLVICLISGGASALMPLPAGHLTLADKQAATSLLLASGAPIEELNCVRKHLSAIKGGRLARLAAPARVISLILSDVVGDDPGVIGSGPTAPDATTFEEARRILHRRGVWDRLPRSVREHLVQAEDETPKPDDPVFRGVENVIVGSNRLALEAARNKSESLDFRTLLLSSAIQGEAREVARVHAAILREIRETGNPVARPACILSGGETTVTLRGSGKGGRNQEFALAAARDIEGLEGVLVLSFGTDGTDGPTDAAGAFADGSTVERADALGFDATRHLDENNAYPLFEALGDLFVTGPTRTNVMDVYLLLSN